MAPHFVKLFRFFFSGKTVSLSEKQYAFQQNWKKYLIITLTVIVPLLAFVQNIYEDYKSYKKYHVNWKDEKLFDVTTFILKDTIAPLITDTVRWKRFALPSKNTALIYNMQDGPDQYDVDIDTLKYTYTLHDNADTAK